MLCLRARKLISAFHDQVLDPVMRARVSAHVDNCRSCRKELDRIMQGAHLARRLRVSNPGPVLKEIPQHETVHPSHTCDVVRVCLAGVAVIAAFTCGIVLRTPLHEIFAGRTAVSRCALDLRAGARDPVEDPVEALRAGYSGRFREISYQGSPGPGWVRFDYKFPSRLPARLHLSSVMVFDPGCCDSLGLVFADGSRRMCILQQPSDRPMSLPGVQMKPERISQYSTSHATLGQYSIDTWTAEGLNYVVMSNLARPETEDAVTSMRYVR